MMWKDQGHSIFLVSASTMKPSLGSLIRVLYVNIFPSSVKDNFGFTLTFLIYSYS